MRCHTGQQCTDAVASLQERAPSMHTAITAAATATYNVCHSAPRRVGVEAAATLRVTLGDAITDLRVRPSGELLRECMAEWAGRGREKAGEEIVANVLACAFL